MRAVRGALLVVGGLMLWLAMEKLNRPIRDGVVHGVVGFAALAVTALLIVVALVLPRWRRGSLLAKGSLARAEVVAMRDTRARVVNPIIELELRIVTGTAPAYMRTVRKDGVPPLELKALNVGRVLAVRVHPEVDDVEVIWGAAPPELPGSYRQ